MTDESGVVPTTAAGPTQEDHVNQPDPRDLLLDAVDRLGPHVDAVSTSDLDRPTPCDGWTVQTLLAHLHAVEHRVAHVMGGGVPFDVPSHREAEDGDWPRAWREGRAVLAASLTDDAVLDAVVQHPAGAMPGRVALMTYVSELTVHAWDLARALGREPGVPPEVAAGVLGPMQAALPSEPRGTDRIPFGAVVEVPDDAPVVDRLVAWVGRDPRWHPAAA